MELYWILNIGNGPFVRSSNLLMGLTERAHGPFWTLDEAWAFIDRWEGRYNEK